MTSRRFREGLLDKPLTTTKRLWVPEDPMLVLRTEPARDGDERAAAMRRLKEPIRNKGTQDDQNEIIDILAKAAIYDASPVLRLEAIGALSRFEDPRAAGILMAAYQNAHGRRDPEPTSPRRPADPGVVPATFNGGRTPVTPNTADRFPITGPTGYPPEWVVAIRCRAAESLGRTNRPEAARFLAAVAGSAGPDIAPDGSDDRDVRLAAVRGLGRCRQPEAVAALAQVLTQETKVDVNGRDTAMIGRTHEGLVRLTGKKLPADAQKWGEVVQAGIVIAPEPGWWDNAVVQAAAWIK